MGDSDSRPEASPARHRRIDPLTRSVWRLRAARQEHGLQTDGRAALSPNSVDFKFHDRHTPVAPGPPANPHSGPRGGRGPAAEQLRARTARGQVSRTETHLEHRPRTHATVCTMGTGAGAGPAQVNLCRLKTTYAGGTAGPLTRPPASWASGEAVSYSLVPQLACGGGTNRRNSGLIRTALPPARRSARCALVLTSADSDEEPPAATAARARGARPAGRGGETIKGIWGPVQNNSRGEMHKECGTHFWHPPAHRAKQGATASGSLPLGLSVS